MANRYNTADTEAKPTLKDKSGVGAVRNQAAEARVGLARIGSTHFFRLIELPATTLTYQPALTLLPRPGQDYSLVRIWINSEGFSSSSGVKNLKGVKRRI